jgi:hypothetical protein
MNRGKEEEEEGGAGGMEGKGRRRGIAGLYIGKQEGKGRRRKSRQNRKIGGFSA